MSLAKKYIANFKVQQNICVKIAKMEADQYQELKLSGFRFESARFDMLEREKTRLLERLASVLEAI